MEKEKQEFINNYLMFVETTDPCLSNEKYASNLYDFMKTSGVIPNIESSISDTPDSKDICGVSYYRKYGDKYTHWTNENWENLAFNDYKDYEEFCMCLVFILAEARKKFEENSSERLAKQEAEDLKQILKEENLT